MTQHRPGASRHRTGAARSVLRLFAMCLVAAMVVAGCGTDDDGAGDRSERSIRVVATTNIVADLAAEIGGDRVEVDGLMGPGVDPHLYRASAGDVGRLQDADVVFYNGLALEGKMGDLLDELASERPTVAVTRDIPAGELTRPEEFEGEYDPHVWFDVSKWKRAARTVAATYEELDPEHATVYRQNLAAYSDELDALERYVRTRLADVPARSRVLATSHDAFGYFGRRYDFDVIAIQGISTAAEATTADIKRVADVIATRGVRTVFVESSVPPQTIEAVLAEAADRGHRAEIGAELFADAAGAAGTDEGTYTGMIRHNVDAIAEGLS